VGDYKMEVLDIYDVRLGLVVNPLLQ
jgi:hypothetical protein